VNGFGQKAIAYGVHLFTACGAVCGTLSLISILRGDWRMCMAWNLVAMFVDGLDGTFARRARVKEVLPEFDGELLDNMVDYLNYVVVPALFIYAADVLPPGTGVIAAACITLSSAYQFCQGDAKTADHFFKGFPSYWNVVALYVLVLDLGAWMNLAAVLVLTFLVFVPIKYLYPSRTARLRRTTLALTAIWGLCVTAMVLSFPNVEKTWAWLSLLYVAYYVGASLYCAYMPVSEEE